MLFLQEEVIRANPRIEARKMLTIPLCFPRGA